MSWIPKPSATSGHERRDAPYLTPDMRQRLERDVLPRYETKLAATLPALRMIQEAYRWIPPQAIEEIADFLDLSAAQVLDTASFYEEYLLEPGGRRLIGVCRSIACEFCGGREITDACREALGVEPGETTGDNEFTLLELECLGSCGSAPVALLDHDLHESLTPQRVREIIAEARAGKRPEAQTSTSDLAAVSDAHA